MLISDLGLRLGADPRGFTAYQALREELIKLSHPARPDVDWVQVEELCLVLQAENGVELQSMAVQVLARTHLYALPGMLEGIQALNCRLPQFWDQLWPLALSARLELLSWVFDQLQPLLRGMHITAEELPRLQQLNDELAGLTDLLLRHAQAPLISLQSLRQQSARVTARLNQDVILSDLPVHAKPALAYPQGAVTAARIGRVTTSHAPEAIVVTVVPSAHVAPPQPPAKRVVWPWLLLVVALAGALGGGYWRWSWVAETQAPTWPIQLDSLLLFAPGSADLRPEATKVLISGLLNIKAQPNWLIVITGHSDSRGDSNRNLEISRSRAIAVKDWMQRMGDIPDSCFVVQGYGAQQPIADNGTERGRRTNRRVEIQLRPFAGACASPRVD